MFLDVLTRNLYDCFATLLGLPISLAVESSRKVMFSPSNGADRIKSLGDKLLFAMAKHICRGAVRVHSVDQECVRANSVPDTPERYKANQLTEPIGGHRYEPVSTLRFQQYSKRIHCHKLRASRRWKQLQVFLICPNGISRLCAGLTVPCYDKLVIDYVRLTVLPSKAVVHPPPAQMTG